MPAQNVRKRKAQADRTRQPTASLNPELPSLPLDQCLRSAEDRQWYAAVRGTGAQEDVPGTGGPEQWTSGEPERVGAPTRYRVLDPVAAMTLQRVYILVVDREHAPASGLSQCGAGGSFSRA